MTDRPKFSTAELAECARRELARRRREFPRMVARAIMNKAEAERELAMMEQITEVFQAWIHHPK
jgi:hypothetical protein